MGREEDWKEIERSQINYEQGIKDQYRGVDIIKISKENKKTIHKLKKFNKKLDNFIKALLICYAIFLTLLIIGGTIFYIMYLNDIKERVNIDAIADLKNTYGIKTKVISQDLDKYENGKYELKSNEDDPIEFTLVKKFGGYNFDYYAHCLKNEYENSGEDIKQIFEPQETYTDEGLLEYSITAKTEDLNGVDNIVNKFVQMREKAGSHYNYSWNVKIQIDDISQKIISFEDTEESITRRVKCNYVISRVDSDNTSMLTKAEIERYYKPYSLKLLVNNEQIFTKYSKPSIEQNVLYNYLEEMYDVPIVCFENVDGVQIVYDSNDNATEITYKNKTYKIQRASLDLENNIIPDAPNTETLKQILGAKFEFDFEKRTLNIVVE